MILITASIRLKLMASFLLLGLAIIIAVTISSYVHMRNTLLDQVERQGAAVTRTFSQLTTATYSKAILKRFLKMPVRLLPPAILAPLP